VIDLLVRVPECCVPGYECSICVCMPCMCALCMVCECRNVCDFSLHIMNDNMHVCVGICACRPMFVLCMRLRVYACKPCMCVLANVCVCVHVCACVLCNNVCVCVCVYIYKYVCVPYMYVRLACK